MKRMILTAAAAILLCGCSAASNNSSAPSSAAEEKQTPHTVSEVFDMLEGSGKVGQLDERADFNSDEFKNACEKLYGVPAESLTDGGIMFSASGQISDEVSMICGGDISLLEKRAETRAKDFEGYAPAESQKAENALVFEYGDYSVLIIADNPDELKRLIEDF